MTPQGEYDLGFAAGERRARKTLLKLLIETERAPRPLPGFSRAATAVAEFLYTGEYALPGRPDIELIIAESK